MQPLSWFPPEDSHVARDRPASGSPNRPVVDAPATLLMPAGARRQLPDLPDDIWTKLHIEFYKNAADAVFKALVE